MSDETLSALMHLARYVEANTCRHKHTHRSGGVVTGLRTTICDDCGRHWSDDRNPFVPYVDPPELVEANRILANPILDRPYDLNPGLGKDKELSDPKTETYVQLVKSYEIIKKAREQIVGETHIRHNLAINTDTIFALGFALGQLDKVLALIGRDINDA